MSTAETVLSQILGARIPQPAWAATGTRARLAVVRRFRGILASRAKEVADLASNPGHSPAEALVAEVLPLLDACLFLERRAERILRPVSLGRKDRPFWLHGVRSEIHREPFGVIGVISPSNYPLYLGGVQVVQALTAGNSVVWKPGLGGGAAARAIAGMAAEAGFPAGLLEVSGEEVECGKALCLGPIDKLVFTGGYENGLSIIAALSGRPVPAVLELSGCDALFVRPDADVRIVAKALRFGLCFNSSRTCMAPRRVFVPATLQAALEEALVQELRDHLSSAPQTVSMERCLRLWSCVEAALSEGARLICGGRRGDDFEWPWVLADAGPQMALLKEDAYAPVVALVTVDSDREALEMASECGFELGASIFSGDSKGAFHMASKVRAGIVSINDLIVPSADPRVPFGGRARSGYGVTRGAEGLLELTRVKVVQVRRTGRLFHLESSPPNIELMSALLRAVHGADWRVRLSGLWNVIRLGCREWLEGRKT